MPSFAVVMDPSVPFELRFGRESRGAERADERAMDKVSVRVRVRVRRRGIRVWGRGPSGDVCEGVEVSEGEHFAKNRSERGSGGLEVEGDAMGSIPGRLVVEVPEDGDLAAAVWSRHGSCCLQDAGEDLFCSYIPLLSRAPLP
jgi:hypothetical protein